MTIDIKVSSKSKKIFNLHKKIKTSLHKVFYEKKDVTSGRCPSIVLRTIAMLDFFPSMCQFNDFLGVKEKAHHTSTNYLKTTKSTDDRFSTSS